MNWLHEIAVWFVHAEAEIWWSMPVPFIGGYLLGRWSKRRDEDD